MLHDVRQRVVGLTASNNSGLTWDSVSWGLESDGCILVMFFATARLLSSYVTLQLNHCCAAVTSLFVEKFMFQFYEVLSGVDNVNLCV